MASVPARYLESFVFYGASEFRQIGFFARAVRGKQKSEPRYK